MKTELFALRLDPDMLRWLRARAKHLRVSTAQVARDLILAAMRLKAVKQ